MFKYKSRCRFTILIALKNGILEIYPGQEITTEEPIDYPSLELIQPEEDKQEVKSIKRRIKEAWQEPSQLVDL